MSDRRTSSMLDSSIEIAPEVSPPILPSADGPASWTTSQGDDGDGGLGTLDDEGDMQDSDDPDTTDNFDQELDESQDHDHDDEDDLEAKMDELYHQLQVETRAKESAESLLEVYRSKDVGNMGNNKLRNQVEQELQATIERIADINLQLDYYKQRAFDPPSFGYLPDQDLKDSQSSIPTMTRRSHSNSFSTSDYADNEDDRQSIHSAVADIVSSLRSLLDSPSVRLEHLSNLVNILKQNPHIHPGYPTQELVSCKYGQRDPFERVSMPAISIRDRTTWTHFGRAQNGPFHHQSERIEALKLVRCFVTTKEGMQHISDGVMRAVIAIAEQNDEKLRNACLETLGEMIMSDPKPVARCGGFRALLVALTDGLQDLSDALLKVFLHMLESPETRIYVRQGLDSEGPSYTDRVKASGRIVTSMVRSWAGLLDLCANNKRAIRSLVQSISLPIQENRRVLLDMLYEIFRIQTPKWLKDFLDGKSVKPTQEELDGYWGSNLQPLGLVDHHQSVVLTVFIEAGLIETLISLVVDDGGLAKTGELEARKVLRKATLLIPELMQLACKVLPPDKSTHVQTLPSLFQVATNFEDPVLRHVAASAFHFIDALSKTSEGIATQRTDDGRGQRNLDRIKQRINTQLDDANFRTLLNDTQVLTTKDVSKWRWNLILEIIQGPMLNPRRLDEAIRGTKFSKRLLAFYRPLNHRYSSQPASESHQTYTKIGCALFEALANSVEGAKYLAQNKILRLIADGLAQLDPMQGHPGSDPIFSREKMETTMTSGYFEMLGTLCKSRSGSRLLEKFKIFNLYYRLSELRSRDDIVTRIITSMDYSIYLDDMSYIEGEMDDWFMFANRQYMIQTEVKLAKAMELQRFNPFSEDGKFENGGELQLTHAKHVLTPHFYGELTRTEEGCELLRKRGHFADYARYIREHCAESKDSTIISELKSVLWAVGSIGSTVGGLPFLEEEDLIKYIVGMAERSKVLSLKGTCFYVLGLLCKTTQGIEILEDYGWQGILHRDRTPRGLCLPKDLDRFLEVPRWSYYRETLPRVVIPLAIEGDLIEKEILRTTGELGNHILTNGASKSLARIKAEYPTYFGSLPLYSAVLDLLSHYHFRLPVRRFVLGLFDMKFEGTTWERLDALGVVTTPGAIGGMAVGQSVDATSASKDLVDILGRTSFDSPPRTTGSNGPSSILLRSPIRSTFPQGSPRPLFSSSSSSTSPLVALGTSRKAREENWMRSDPEKLNGAPPLLDASRKHEKEENGGINEADPLYSPGSNADTNVVSPTLTMSQPPIPPPRPPPHAYEILYTNKPYHKNFAKEAGLAPLPPRVKVALPGPEEEEDPMPMEARQSSALATTGAVVSVASRR
ncbi:hypothetical protein EDD11_001279 [Mortierella claussenii]|nr:hypothetical protein EDD11_001279 [Mortierella claussenii]